VFLQFCNSAVDLGIFADVARNDDFAAEVVGKACNAIFEPVSYIGKRQFGTLFVACLGNTVGD
jgi:hypothetical protein